VEPLSRGSVLVTLQAGVVVSGLLPFWPDIYALWTHGAVPYDPVLGTTLLIGTAVIAPSILALSYANYSNRGDLLVRTRAFSSSSSWCCRFCSFAPWDRSVPRSP
jgi:hypothetical protein